MKIVGTWCGAALAALALSCGALVACSSSDSADDVTTRDAGNDAARDAGGGSASDAAPAPSPGTDAGAPEGDSGPPSGCHAPSLHPPPSDAGVFCPFSGVDGGDDVYCARATEQCCETPSDDAGASTCNAAGGACPVNGSTLWQCEDSANCASGQVCCAAVTLEQDSTCGYYRAAAGFTGTACKAACANGEMQICQQPSSCKTGTCTPFRAVGNSVGACK